MTTTYTIRRDVPVEMPDGTTLATDVYLPDAPGPAPTLLQRTPYDKSDPFGSQFIVQMTVLRALDAGFAVVVQDTRGRYASGGAFEPFNHEGADGSATVAWIREQEFSDGRVASYGASYVGATQMLLAREGSEGHVAMAPFLTTGDYHDGWTYRGGALQLGLVYLWITEALGPSDLEARGLPSDHPARSTSAQMLADPWSAMKRLPILDADVVELAPYLRDWLEHPTHDEFWSTTSVIDQVERVQSAALHVAGFNDVFLEGSLTSYQALRKRGATEFVRDGQYLVIGPWSHGNIGDWQGQMWHGYHASAPALDLVGMQLGFFSAILSNARPDLPRVTYFTSGTNQWHAADEWPPPGTVSQHLHLTVDGELAATAPDVAGVRTYTSNPLDPVPSTGGATFLPGLLINRNDGPQEQASVEERTDVLVFRGPPLEAALHVAGEVRLELLGASSAHDCDWTARLVDVHPDGRAYGIVDGILRSRYRDGRHPQPLTPGKPTSFDVVLGNTSHVFGAGHRIGLQVASSNFPRFDRNPQSMVEPARARVEDFVVAEQSVITGGPRPSRLALPVLEA